MISVAFGCNPKPSSIPDASAPAEHDHGGPGPGPTAAPAPVGSGQHYGGEFKLEQTEPLAAVVARMSDEAKTVKVTGMVDSVCQTKGCWMVLKDGDVQARVFTKKHAYFLPKRAAGSLAVAEGSLRVKTISEKFAKHLEEDSGGDPATITGPQQEIVMDASAIQLLPSDGASASPTSKN